MKKSKIRVILALLLCALPLASCAGLLPGGASGEKVVAVNADALMAIKADGSLWSWGMTGPDQTPKMRLLVSRGVKSMAGTGMRYFIVMRNGELWTWGYNSMGILPDLDGRRFIERPAFVRGGVKAVYAGEYYALVLLDGGELLCLGNEADMGALPGRLEGFPYRGGLVSGRVKSAAAGEFHSVFLSDDGVMKGWMSMPSDPSQPRGLHALPDESATGEQILAQGVTAVAADPYDSFAVTGKRELVAWGLNHQRESMQPDGSVKLNRRLSDEADKDALAGDRLAENVKKIRSSSGPYAFTTTDDSLWLRALPDDSFLHACGDPARRHGSGSFAAPDVMDFDLVDHRLFVVKKDGTLWGCGADFYGALRTGGKDTGGEFVRLDLPATPENAVGLFDDAIFGRDGEAVP